MADYPVDIQRVDPVVGEPGGQSVALGDPLQPPDAEDRLLVVVPPSLEAPAKQAFGDASVDIQPVDGGPEMLSSALREASDPEAALVVVPPKTPFERCPGPVHHGIPVGVIRAARSQQLRSAIVTDRSVALHAVLAMGTDEYLEPADRLRASLTDEAPAGIPVADWRANRIARPALCRRLAGGPALAVYHGHGRARSLGGYQGIHWPHVAAVPLGRPVGTLVALACDTLGRTRAPIAERFVATGRAAAVLGAVRSVDQADVAALSRRLGETLARENPATIGGLLQCLTQAGHATLLDPYRLVGLPTRRLR